MQKPAKKYFTVQEYLELEESAEYKSEYYKGEIFAMAGASSNHNQIIGNVYSRLHQTINKHNCRVFMSDLRLWIEQKELFTYPDIMIICDKPKFYPDRDDTVVNPLIIIEAISKSTEAYDRSKKFLFYRSIPTFQEYILINQYSPHIEQFYIGAENHWLFKDYNSISDILKFSKIDFEIPLENIYYLVDFKLVENLEA
jgi:Uma2 family endonuclease